MLPSIAHIRDQAFAVVQTERPSRAECRQLRALPVRPPHTFTILRRDSRCRTSSDNIDRHGGKQLSGRWVPQCRDEGSVLAQSGEEL